MVSSAVMQTRRPFAAMLMFFIAFSAFPKAAQAELDPANAALCYAAIDRASSQMGTPRDVMLAISLTETGKRLGEHVQPWPWTVNMEGKGFWFETLKEALAFVHKRFSQGARSFDVGCFQINYKWHHQHFRSIEDMFDPVINATYAAKFLNTLFAEKGSWSKAAGAYHSRTPSFAERYAARFDRYRARLSGQAPRAGDVLGHGSEPLRLAAKSTAPAPKPPQQFKGLPLGSVQPQLSSGSRPLGSLAAPSGSDSGLIRRSAGSLF